MEPNFIWNGSEWDNPGGLLTGTGAIRVEFMVISWQEDTFTGLYKSIKYFLNKWIVLVFYVEVH